MSRSPIQNLRADDMGRLILDLQTPAEFTAQPGGWFDFYLTIKDTQTLPTIKVDLR